MTGFIVLGCLLTLALLFLFLDQRFSCGWTGGAAPDVSANPLLTGDTSIESTFSLASGAITDQQQQVGFDVAAIKGLLITVEDNDLATVTLETNATDATGGQTFVFPIGGGELYWTSRSPTTCPITLDIVTTYWTKSATIDEPTIKIRVLFNA